MGCTTTGLGADRRLLDAVLELAADRGAERLWLVTQPKLMVAAANLYQHYGFRLTRKVHVGPVPAIEMELTL